MSDFLLIPQLPLGDIQRTNSNITLTASTGLAVVSIATPNGGDIRLAEQLEAAYGAQIPKVGSSSLSADGKARFLRLQHDQIFLLFEYSGDNAVSAVSNKLGETGYFTDHSDSWAMLQISGSASRDALERICTLDLDPQTFSIGAVSRTAMDHLGVIILRDGNNSFLLLSPRSSANSFLQAIEVSIANTS